MSDYRGTPASSQIVWLEGEVKRLRAELAAERERGWKAHAANLSLAEDNEALRALLREARESIYDTGMQEELVASIDAALNKGGDRD